MSPAKFLRSILALTLWGLLWASAAGAWDLKSHYDNQIWPEIQTTTKFNQYFDFILNGQLRIGRDVSTLVREQGVTGFDFRAIKYLSVSVRYMSIGDQPTPDNKSYENRVQFYPTIHIPLGDLKIDLVNMFEYRFRYPLEDSIRYRPSLKLEHPLGPKSLGLSAYVKEEGFYSTQFSEFYRFRSYVGFKKNVNDMITLELYYCRQQDGKTMPGNLNIIGTVIAFEFDVAKLRGKPAKEGK
jgi:hypothetical protein